MCGIAGIIARAGSLDFEGILHSMTSALAHRGPDGEGTIFRQSHGWQIGLAHTRLAIIDLSRAGHQPMAGRQNTLWLTYNGEVYNFKELREQLESKNLAFQSQTDSEVILRAFEVWDLASFRRLRGMFAMGLWDQISGRLVLARDPFGIKPLYYYCVGSVFVFASEIRALLASGLIPRRASIEGLTSYLQYGSVQEPAAIVEGVRSLPSGYSMVVEPQKESLRIEQNPYWAWPLSDRLPVRVSDRREAAEMLRHIEECSVRLHLVSDVPLGLFLSGGIDSSVLAAVASRTGHQRLKTFTVAMAEEKYSEAAHYARVMAQRLGTDHREIPLAEHELLAILPTAFGAMDQPTIDGINTFVISKAVKGAGVTVAISGLGGDELFAGYPSFRRMKWMQRIAKIPRPFLRAASAAGRRVSNGSVPSAKLWDLLDSEPAPLTAYRISRQLFGPEEIRDMMVDVTPRFDAADSVSSADPINEVSRCEMQGYMKNTLLRDTDSMSMAHALEVRVPFIDTAVVEYVLGLPGKWKLESLRPKPLLLDSAHELIPKEVWQRPKKGFTLPFEAWMHLALKPEIDAMLLGKESLWKLPLDSKVVGSLWRTFRRTPKRERWSRPWAIYALFRWCIVNQIGL